jgi:adenylate cyclase
VNKFLGDGFMAVFGAPLPDPDYCRHAVEAGLEILAKLDERVAEEAIPPTRIGIALHAGAAVVGNVGSTMRKEYTVIGDVVNVASRLETLNKDFGSRMLVTERVWSEAGRPEDAVPRPAITVRGREEPVQIFQLA